LRTGETRPKMLDLAAASGETASGPLAFVTTDRQERKPTLLMTGFWLQNPRVASFEAGRERSELAYTWGCRPYISVVVGLWSKRPLHKDTSIVSEKTPAGKARISEERRGDSSCHALPYRHEHSSVRTELRHWLHGQPGHAPLRVRSRPDTPASTLEMTSMRGLRALWFGRLVIGKSILSYG